MIATLCMLPFLVQSPVNIPTEDGGLIDALLYGRGRRAVVLVHGGRFSKESWKPQVEILQQNGFRVLAIDLRGKGKSRGPGDSDPYTAPLHLDVLAAVRYLQKSGSSSVYVIGGSMGGSAAADALALARPGEIQRLVMLGTGASDEASAKLTGRKLIIVAREDASGSGPRLPGIQASFAKIPEPKRLIIVDGNAHAQFLFQSDQSERVMREILAFLTAP
jgi:pimeloyl-ACP methyl ester carboxylesterase